MKGFLGLCLFACLVVASKGVFWADLRVKYDVNPIGNFVRMPRTVLDAEQQGWSIISNESDCSNAGKYSGYRYVVPGDHSLVLMYDVQGTISGLQMLLPHDEILPNNTFRFFDVPHFTNGTIDDRDYFILTAYFVEPAEICSTGRNETDLIDEGTGRGAWIQIGDTPSKLLPIPDLREEALLNGWSNNNCFPGMGRHSWYRMEDYEASNCEVQVPVFGLWNRQMELQGFGFSVSGTTVNPHFENPPTAAVQIIAGSPAPDCLFEANDLIGSTTMHVYFVDTPWLTPCPIA